ncbi:F0F1 ATP synthase subunit A [uncultured Anaeromusa sp.]|uniref:F0F1 ATP synthase subunit A n=1 Tax=uncultured Anaeromusa sp. TaxID=673273 RepID=UPI0029C89AF2|nr:F0F1 ATP synthase subunit A [uncultured Anaeromusa sp.]
MSLTPDALVFWQYGFVKLNLTIVMTWVTMTVLVFTSWVITRQTALQKTPSRWQGALEAIVLFVREQIREMGILKAERYLAFLTTLFLFNLASALGGLIPGYESPTSSLSTTSALALLVFFAVPIFGIYEKGIWRYLKQYSQPNVLLLPFNLITEVSRTVALAVRLFGNMASGAMLVAMLLALAPLLFPVILQVLGLLTGVVQAYIFSMLALVYIAAAVSSQEK